MDSTRTPRTTALREQMRADLHLAGLSERTQEAYLYAVAKFAHHFGRPPDQLSEAELRQYFLFLKNEKHFAPASLKLTFCGLAFFYTHTAPSSTPASEMHLPSLRPLPLPGTSSCRSPRAGLCPPAADEASQTRSTGLAGNPLCACGLLRHRQPTSSHLPTVASGSA
jgi:hypothetical protein